MIVCTVLMYHPCPCINLVPYLVHGEYMYFKCDHCETSFTFNPCVYCMMYHPYHVCL